MSTSWKTGTLFFLLGVLSTGGYALGAHAAGALIWGGSLAYLGYLFYESRQASHYHSRHDDRL